MQTHRHVITYPIPIATPELYPIPIATLPASTYPIALHAALSILLLIAWYAHNLLLTRDETLVANWLLADFTAEALLMPLLALVLVLLHACKQRERWARC